MKKMLFRLAMIGVVGMITQAQSALVAYWDFNEGSGTVLHDRSGNGNNGVIYGALWSNGFRGNALSFNGISNYVELQTPASFQLQRFSFSCWMQTADPYSPQERTLFSNVQALSGLANGFIVRINTDSMLNFCLARADLQGYWINLNHRVAISAGSYHFVAATYDGAVMKLYFDSTLVGQLSYTGGVKYGSVYPDIGAARSNSGYPGYFKGTIDEMRIYNSALSDAEIKTLYSKNTPILTEFLYPVSSPSYNRRPVLSWHSLPGVGGYTVQIDTVKGFTSPIYSIPTLDTVFAVPLDLPIDTIYWQVIAGVNDTCMYYSTVGSFLIQNPKVPLLIPYVPKVTLERKPILRWHPVAGASSYTIEIGNDVGFVNNSYIIPVSDTQYSPSVNLPFGETYWRVQSSLAPAWSAFDMLQIVPDSIPFLIRYNGAVVSAAKPLFVWHPVVGASSYTVELADNASFTGGYVVPLTDTSFAPLVALSNGTWFWRVSCSKNPAMFCAPDSLVIASVLARAERRAAAVPFAVRSVRSRIEITADFSTNANVKITLFTAIGKKVLERCVTAGGTTVSIDAVEVPAGIYLMELIAGEKCIRQKVMLAR